MKNLLNRLFQHETLDRAEARQVLLDISAGQYKQAEIAAFITVFQLRDIQLLELQGFRDALLESCIQPNLGDDDAIDLCGTGGDAKDSFNISTLSAFVLAAAGYKVIKHGNYGVSSLCGSSNVLEALGYQFSKEESLLRAQLEEHNICFLHAPLFHPAMKSVASLRKDLGFRSFFNLLGPLVNPVQPSKQLVGVSDLKVMRLYQYLLQESGRDSFAIVHSLDGFDEVSLTADFKMITRKGEAVFSPSDIYLDQTTEAAIAGGRTIAESATIFRNIISGAGTRAQNQVVAANAGIALQQFQPEKPLYECILQALELLETGAAGTLFERLIKDQLVTHHS